jgi:diamine N-acetyltransferase
MPIELRPLDDTNWRPLARLSRTLTWEQTQYVAHNAYTILEAMHDPDHLVVRGAYDGDEPVGLVMWADIRDEEPNSYYIVRLMVAGPHQGKGYGRAIMQQVIDLLKDAPGCEKLYISFMPENAVARALYASLGFEDTGRVDDGEVIYLLRMRQS